MHRYKVSWEIGKEKHEKVYEDYKNAIKARNYLIQNGADYAEVAIVINRKKETQE